MSSQTALALSLLIPFVGSVLIALTGRNPNLREGVTLATAGLLFADVLWLLVITTAGGPAPSLMIGEVMPGLALALKIEPLGMMFAMIASGLWIVNSIYSIGYMRGNNEHSQTRFYVCFAIAILSAVGVALAANMFTLFIFYEVLTISTYPLVAHKETKEARQGGRTYLGILIGTSIWIANGRHHLDLDGDGHPRFHQGRHHLAGKVAEGLVPVLLALYMFGIGKAALMPFHRWLPAAMVAPTPVSALLHAVAVVKAGVFTVMKVIVYIFGVRPPGHHRRVELG